MSQVSAFSSLFSGILSAIFRQLHWTRCYRPQRATGYLLRYIPELKEAKNAEASRAIAAGYVPNDDFIKGG